MKSSLVRAALVAAFLAVPTLASTSARPAQGGEPARSDVVRAEAWPKLGADVVEKVKLDVERLRKARTPEMSTQARDALLTYGAGAAPNLIAALAREEDRDARVRVVEVLDLLTTAEHSRLLAKEFASKSPNLRKWALARTATFLDPGVAKAAEAALASAKKGLDKKETDKEEVMRAAIACASAGSVAGFDVLIANAYDNWGKYGADAHAALAGVRGAEATKLVAAGLKPSDSPKPNDPALKAPDRARIVGALRLLGGCGDESARSIVKPFLDSNDNTVRIAAINAVRALLDGEQPLVDLPVFDAVEMAKKLKARL
ncbi:MAG: hypothetical protein L6Q99_04165 [Planctomycetes bacterium]|nr:hypothetical protein [Planctomycetota bacterium]